MLYALLVGINAYQPPLRPLRGCRNDVAALEQFLSGRFPADQVRALTLLDEEATRQRVLTTFRWHLGQAGPNDTALFFFAGHGSREQSPAEYRYLEPDGLSDTLVAFDSRNSSADAWDISDKEICVLVAEVAAHGAHIVVILDCCHSGTATRAPWQSAWRRAEPRIQGLRPASSLWFRNDKTASLLDAPGHGTWRTLPRGRHVMLAACEDHQLAGECSDSGGERRGRFSYHLVRALHQQTGSTTYRHLFKLVQNLVCNETKCQVPQAYGELDTVVFDGNTQARPAILYLKRTAGGDWRLEAGRVQAMREETVLDVLDHHPEGNPGATVIARVVVTSVDAAESEVQVIAGDLPEDHLTLFGYVSELKIPLLTVALEATTLDTGLRRRIERSPLLAVGHAGNAALFVSKAPRGFRLRNEESGEVLFSLEQLDLDTVEVVTEALEKIARWRAFADLGDSGVFPQDDVKLTVFRWLGPPSSPTTSSPAEAPLVDPLPEGHRGPVVAYDLDDRPGRITARLENRSYAPLYYSLFSLSESFEIRRIVDASGRVPGLGGLWLRASDGIAARVPDRLHQLGITQRRDLLLLLASEQETSFDGIEQDGVNRRTTSDRAPSNSASSVYLLPWTKCRNFNQNESRPARWAARVLTITSLRPHRADTAT